MIKINNITIHGFKSFAHKTIIPFEDKFNCILGPNGSGKSNVSDAICFVLGRISAKSMRAEKASNLIFNGGKKFKPAAQGTVEISFSNLEKTFPLEEPEIVVSRTITKNGNSIYRVNGKKKTRTEIIDLLSLAKINPDGYNIILQGDITRFVTMSLLERRQIIEEISDVSIYEEKKHRAILELNKVEEKLNNAEIILKERKTYLKELKTDRDQALKFKDLRDKIDSNKATFLHHQIKDKSEVKEKFEKDISKFQEKIDSSNQKIEELKKSISAGKEKITAINHEIEQKGEKEQVRVHKEIEDLKINIAKDRTRISVLKDEINKIKLRKDQLKIEIEDLERKFSSFNQNQKDLEKTIQSKRKELKEVEEKILQFKTKNKIETSHELEKEIEDKDKVIEQKQEEAQNLRQQQQELLREKDRLEFQLESLDGKIQKVKEIEEQNKDQLKLLQQHKSNFKEATLKLSKCLDQDSGFSSQLANARRKLVELQEKQSKLQAKSLSLQASLSANQALRSILDNRKKFPGVRGTVAELGQVEKKYSLALEVAAGGKMQHLIVEEDKDAAECIKYLKDNKLGTASFIPLNKIKYQEISEEDKKLLKSPGAQEFALNLITFKPQFRKAFAHVFGNSLVVDDIDVARKVGVGRIRMSTMDGNLVESSGVMRGGFIDQKKPAGFKEKDSLEELENIEKEIEELQGVISNVEVKRAGNEKEISFLRNHKSELEAEIIKLEKTLHLESGDLEATNTLKKDLREKLKESDEKISQVQKKISSFNHELAELKSKKQNLRSEVNQLRDPRLLAQLSAFEELRQKNREELFRMESDLKNSKSQVDQMISPEKVKIQEIKKQHDKEEAQFTEEIKRLGSAIEVDEKELKEKEKASQDFYSKYRELFNQREKIGSEINRSENEIESWREKIRNNEREINLVSLQNAETKAKLAGLEEEFQKYKEVKVLSNKSLEELKEEISKFEIMLGQMSAVNMKALEIYEQIDREYNKLVEKKEELIKEKTDVLTLMNEIETKKKENFMKTFEKINENFQKIFNNLFKKGRAYLQLENPNNPFEDGVSIKVKISGNRFMDLKSLSGGEKTLTALSLIFAIQEDNPASFYILDEIDAALDKHNAETLSKLLRSYSQNAQYIVISHNDAIISEADTLFGVSMNDGISKVTSLKI